MTHHRVSYYSNTTGATSGTGTAFPSGVHLGLFDRVAVSQSLVFCVVFSRSYFVPFRMTIVMSVLRLTASDHDYPFGIFKLFLAPRPETHYILKTCCHSFILILF